MEPIQWKRTFDSPAFEAKFHTDLPLGAFCAGRGTLFRLWAPTAQRVRLRTFSAGVGGGPEKVQDLTLGLAGVWMGYLPDCPSGTYYDYLVAVDGNRSEFFPAGERRPAGEFWGRSG